MKKYLMMAMMVSCALAPALSRAEASPELMNYLQDQIQVVGSAVSQCEADAPDSAQATDTVNQDWYFRRFWLRVRPNIGISIPGLAKFEVVPEVEMLFQRPYPAGWTDYNPAARN